DRDVLGEGAGGLRHDGLLLVVGRGAAALPARVGGSGGYGRGGGIDGFGGRAQRGGVLCGGGLEALGGHQVDGLVDRQRVDLAGHVGAHAQHAGARIGGQHHGDGGRGGGRGRGGGCGRVGAALLV